MFVLRERGASCAWGGSAPRPLRTLAPWSLDVSVVPCLVSRHSSGAVHGACAVSAKPMENPVTRGEKCLQITVRGLNHFAIGLELGRVSCFSGRLAELQQSMVQTHGKAAKVGEELRALMRQARASQ